MTFLLYGFILFWYIFILIFISISNLTFPYFPPLFFIFYLSVYFFIDFILFFFSFILYFLCQCQSNNIVRHLWQSGIFFFSLSRYSVISHPYVKAWSKTWSQKNGYPCANWLHIWNNTNLTFGFNHLISLVSFVRNFLIVGNCSLILISVENFFFDWIFETTSQKLGFSWYLKPIPNFRAYADLYDSQPKF